MSRLKYKPDRTSPAVRTHYHGHAVVALLHNSGPRAVFVRHRFDDATNSEITAELGISIAKAETYVAAAMAHRRSGLRVKNRQLPTTFRLAWWQRNDRNLRRVPP